MNGPAAELNEFPGAPYRARNGAMVRRPGFHIPAERSEWFSRVLARTAAASLLAFAGDRTAARNLLTPRQQRRVGTDFEHPSSGGVRLDTEVTLGGMRFVGTDHIFRFGSRRIEAFSGVFDELHSLLAQGRDVQGYESALPSAMGRWAQRRNEVKEDWGGAIAMDGDGAVMALRVMGDGRAELR